MNTDTFLVGELVITPTSLQRDFRAVITRIWDVTGVFFADVKFEEGQDICETGCYRLATLTKI